MGATSILRHLRPVLTLLTDASLVTRRRVSQPGVEAYPEAMHRQQRFLHPRPGNGRGVLDARQ
ncbi:hypothetical protein BW733_08735 [Tessaracoccus flavescens]|uniref:Uncharacterized protein n=1 Tax=Tessaracoccus flavescens TaxID=399497 RepID=A0A1Q2CXT3_9ACTN|nr:hypothetical protein BW733_08735 [Tessaracoccus flavescens]